MLSNYGLSLDDAVGYRVLDADEELEFREECGKNDLRNGMMPVVRYYGRKPE